MISRIRYKLRSFLNSSILRRLEYDGNVAIEILIEKVAVFDEMKLIFIRVPKAGNSSIVNSLLNFQLSNSVNMDLLNHQKNKLSPKNNLSFMLNGLPKDYKVMTVVREPTARVTSCYKHLIMGGVKPNALGASGRVLSFDEFLDRLENGYLFKNAHWAPQTSITPKVNTIDYILKLESIDKCWKTFQEKTGVDIELLKYAPHATSGTKFELTEAQIKRIEKLYASDYVKFGYERQFEKWL